MATGRTAATRLVEVLVRCERWTVNIYAYPRIFCVPLKYGKLTQNIPGYADIFYSVNNMHSSTAGLNNAQRPRRTSASLRDWLQLGPPMSPLSKLSLFVGHQDPQITHGFFGYTQIHILIRLTTDSTVFAQHLCVQHTNHVFATSVATDRIYAPRVGDAA